MSLRTPCFAVAPGARITYEWTKKPLKRDQNHPADPELDEASGQEGAVLSPITIRTK